MARTPEEWLTLLNRRLIGRQAAMALHENYYDGQHRATFILARLLEAFGRDFRDLRINYCSVVVDALNERLNLDGFLLGTDARASAAAWEIWQRSGMDDEFSRGTRSALVKSEFGLIVWPDAAGEPRLTVEDGAQLIVAVDPADKRVRRAALKRWYDEDERRTYADALPARGDLQVPVHGDRERGRRWRRRAARRVLPRRGRRSGRLGARHGRLGAARGGRRAVAAAQPVPRGAGVRAAQPNQHRRRGLERAAPDRAHPGRAQRQPGQRHARRPVRRLPPEVGDQRPPRGRRGDRQA